MASDSSTVCFFLVCMLALLLLVELNCGSCWVHSVSLHWLVDCVFICVCQTKDRKDDVGFSWVRFAVGFIEFIKKFS